MNTHPLKFYLNGKRVVLDSFEPNTTLLRYLRSPTVGLVGTKESCGNGICGACSVLFTYHDVPSNSTRVIPVNACALPLVHCHGTAIWTIEGNNTTMKPKLNPIQEAFVKHEGTQCGFCLPGIIMSTSALFEKHKVEKLEPPTVGDIEETLTGHTCRCTGYRPIFQTMSEFFTKEGTKAPDMSFPEFPKELQQITEESLAIQGSIWQYFRPTTLKELEETWAKFPEARVIGAATHSQELFRDLLTKRTIISTSAVSELKNIEIVDGKLVMGAAASVEQLLAFAKAYMVSHPDCSTALHTIAETIPRLRSKQIRSTSTIAGEIVAESEIGALFLALGANLTFKTHCDATKPKTCTPLTTPNKQADTPYQASRIALFQCCETAPVNPLILSISVPVPCGGKCAETRNFSDAVLVSRRKDNFAVLMMVVYTGVAQKGADGQWTLKDVNAVLCEGRHNTDRETTQKTSCSSTTTSTSSSSTPPPPHAEKVSVIPRCIAHRLPLTSAALASIFATDSFAVAQRAMGEELEAHIVAAHSGAAESDASYKAACEALAASGARPPIPTSWLTRQYIATAGPSTLLRFASNLARWLNAPLAGAPLRVLTGIKKEDAPAGPTELAPPQSRFRHTLQEWSCDFEKVDTLLGSPVGNMHVPSHAAGTTVYTVDVPMEHRGLHGGMILSTIPHGIIKSIDASKALALPGVVDMVTAADIPGLNAHTGIVMDTKIFADKEVECVHQPIGMILATTPEVAEYAASQVHVEYEELPAVLTLEEAYEKGSFLKGYEGLFVELGDSNGVIKAAREEMAAEGDKSKFIVIDGEAKCGGQDHYYAEMQNCVVIPHDGTMEVYSSTQNPSKVQFDVAGAVGLPRAKVSCKAMRLGGGYGGKQDRPCIFATAAAVAAYKLGRPIRVTMKRTADMQVHGGRHPMWLKYTVVVDRATGKLEALTGKVISHGGYAHDVTGPVLFKAAFQLQSTYTIPHMHMTACAVKTNHNPNTAFRGFGAPQATYFMEQVLDHVGDVLKMNQYTLRDINLQKVGDKLMTGSLISQAQGEKFIRVMWDQLVKTAEWEKRCKAVDEFNATHTDVKRGIAITPMKNGACFEDDFMNQAQALVHVLPDGSVEVSHSGIEMGQGLNTKIAQLAAEVLGCDLKFIHVLHTCTDTCANTQPTAASTGFDLNGGAVREACKKIVAQLAELRAKNPDKTWPELCNTAYFTRHHMSGQAHFILPSINWQWVSKTGFTAFYYNFGVSVSEVEVDVLTGEYTILRSDLIEDAGRAANPTLDLGQIEGGFIQGIGWLMSEDVEYDIGTGAMLTDAHTYAAPLLRDVPLELHTTIAHGFSCDQNVGGSKTTAESPVLLAVSVLMAARHAVNAARADRGLPPLRYQMSPFTVDRIKLAIEGKLDGLDGIQYKPAH